MFDPLFANLYVADYGSDLIRRITMSSLQVTTIAGTFLVADYTRAYGNTFYEPTGVLFDQAGNLIISDDGHNTIRKYWPATGLVATIIGSGVSPSSALDVMGPGLQCTINPQMMAWDSNYNLYTGDYNCSKYHRAPTSSCPPPPTHPRPWPSIDRNPPVQPRADHLVTLTKPPTSAVTLSAPICDDKWHHTLGTFNGYGFFDM